MNSRVVLGGSAFAFLAAALVLLALRAEAQAPKSGGPPPAAVVATRVVEKEVSAGRTFIGTLQPRRRSVVGSAVDGRVVEYPVNDGQWVKKGDTLAQLLTRATEIERDHAKAQLKFAHEELRELENGSQPEEIVQARATLESSKAQLEYARARHKRNEALYQRGGTITQEDMDLSYSTLTAAEQNYLAAKAAFDLVERGPREEKIAQAKANVAAAQELLNQLEDRLEKFTIKAPFDGYVVAKHTEVGAWISRGDDIAEVIEIDPLEVDMAVPETSIASLQEAMTSAEQSGQELEAVVKIDALGGKPFSGSVERIVPQADLRSRTFPVKIRLPNQVLGKSHILKAGMICHVALPVGSVQKVLLVPKDALVLGGPSPRLIVVDSSDKGPVAKAVPIQIGAAYGSLIEVSGGIQSGDQVVIRGNERLQPGQALSVADTAEN